MEKIEIHYSIRGGKLITFGIPLHVRKAIKSAFPDARPSTYLTISYEIHSGLDDVLSDLDKHVLPIVLGLRNASDWEKIGRIHFVKTPEMQVTNIIEQNYEPEVQLVSW
jgi:hypothetical protein